MAIASGLCGQIELTNDEAFEVRSQISFRAHPFALKDVRLLDGPFRHAMDTDGRYLLQLDPDRLLSGFRTKAGLEPKGQVYGGWEKETIAGHSLGHYLSACSLMYAQTGDRRFRKRVDYIVDELALCQNAHGDGYVAAFPRGREIFDEVRRGDIRTKGFDLNGCWVPLYTLHKQMAGLLDAHRLCASRKAINVASKLADYLHDKFGGLSDEQMQTLLNCEHGGINEALANLYAVTGNRTYLRLSQKIYHKAVLDPLAARRDELEGKHANTQVPKVIGMARLAELTGSTRARTIAEFFWRTVVANHTYANGGNSAWEYFGPPRKLSDRLGDTTETCNTYNMLKLTRHLFAWTADARYADYYERALYNHILAHQHPETGMFVYKGFLDRGTEKHYSTPFDSFWCCVGTGMENHAKYGESIYFHRDSTLYVNLFIASKVNFRDRGISVIQETTYPKSDKTKLTIQCAGPVDMAMKIRHPYWAVDGLQIAVNGRNVEAGSKPGSFATVRRRWSDGDVVEVKMPMNIRVETMPDNPDRLAFMYGPVLLCGDVGDGEIPVLVAGNKDVVAGVKPVIPANGTEARHLRFVTEGLGKPRDFPLVPLYEMHDRRYNVYFDRFTPEQWAARQAERAAEESRRRELERRTIDVLRIGEMQPERDHSLEGENTSAGSFNGRKWRHAYNGWFAFDMKVRAKGPVELMVEYWGSETGRRQFDILIEGRKVATQKLLNNQPGEFFFATYAIPEELTEGKEKVTVKFRSHPGCTAGGVFGCRTVTPEHMEADG